MSRKNDPFVVYWCWTEEDYHLYECLSAEAKIAGCIKNIAEFVNISSLDSSLATRSFLALWNIVDETAKKTVSRRYYEFKSIGVTPPWVASNPVMMEILHGKNNYQEKDAIDDAMESLLNQVVEGEEARLRKDVITLTNQLLKTVGSFEKTREEANNLRNGLEGSEMENSKLLRNIRLNQNTIRELKNGNVLLHSRLLDKAEMLKELEEDKQQLLQILSQFAKASAGGESTLTAVCAPTGASTIRKTGGKQEEIEENSNFQEIYRYILIKIL